MWSVFGVVALPIILIGVLLPVALVVALQVWLCKRKNRWLGLILPGLSLLFSLAKELHAEVGASRAAVDAGFAEHDRQIGQTGVTVRPKLYIACGISGQIQHIAGMQESGIIISINNDPDAPINTIADYVINGTIEEVVPKMIKYYKQNSK